MTTPDPVQQYEHRPALHVLWYVPPADFAPVHLERLERLAQHAWDGTTAKEFALRIHRGDSHLFEVRGTDAAIVLISVRQGEPDLFLEGLAGDGIIRLIPFILSDLKSIAREYGCRFIDTSTAREDAFAGLAQKMGFTPISTNYRLELEDEDGQQENPNDAIGTEG